MCKLQSRTAYLIKRIVAKKLFIKLSNGSIIIIFIVIFYL